ncbi:hypothetical protein [Nocardia inohanensis]|uniref:hypothetical protein n=1 Tax=Nocardia inohanensis TaxID=209246 RepID=UPI00082FEAD2|nr:hypothetical protein [Nocardia inohanensis]
MRNTLPLLLVTLTAATGLALAPQAAAEPAPIAGTGSSAADSATAAANSAVVLAQQGDLIGLIVLLGVTPIHMLTGGLCDLVTTAGSSNPCSPSRYPAAHPSGS